MGPDSRNRLPLGWIHLMEEMAAMDLTAALKLQDTHQSQELYARLLLLKMRKIQNGSGTDRGLAQAG